MEMKLREGAHNRRRNARKLTFWNGQLLTSKGQFDCRVVNMSENGAQIKLVQKPAGSALPILGREPITLVITRLGRFSGSIAWQHGGSLGLRLVPLDSRDVSPSDREPVAGSSRRFEDGVAVFSAPDDVSERAIGQPQSQNGAAPIAGLLRRLLDRLPPPESEWSVSDRVKWLQTAANLFDLVYKGSGGIKIEPITSQPSSDAVDRAPPFRARR